LILEEIEMGPSPMDHILQEVENESHVEEKHEAPLISLKYIMEKVIVSSSKGHKESNTSFDKDYVGDDQYHLKSNNSYHLKSIRST